MVYKTRPYFQFLPVIPNVFKSYEVDDEELRGNLFGDAFMSIALPIRSLEKEPGFVQDVLNSVFNIGNVIVTDKSGQTYTFHRVFNVSGFMTTIRKADKKVEDKIEETEREIRRRVKD